MRLGSPWGALRCSRIPCRTAIEILLEPGVLEADPLGIARLGLGGTGQGFQGVDFMGEASQVLALARGIRVRGTDPDQYKETDDS